VPVCGRISFGPPSLRGAQPRAQFLWEDFAVKPIARGPVRRRAGAALAIATTGSLLLIGAGSAVAATSSSGPAKVAVPQGISPQVLKNAHAMGAASGSTKETVSFVLKARDLSTLEARVNGGMTGGYLSVREFASTYGRTKTAISRLTKYLAKFHITSSVHADHIDVTTHGTVAEYNKALGVKQTNFEAAAVPASHGHLGRPATVFHGTTQPAMLPANVASIVLAILGLTNYPSWQSDAVHTPALARGEQPATVRTGGQTPADFASRYHLNTLQKAGAKGQGQTIGIVTLASLNKSDATHFWSKVLKIKTKANRITLDNIDGGAGAVSNNKGSGETTLDVEQSGALAPQANIIVYQAPNTDPGFFDAFAVAASQNKADTVSSSWGESEDAILTSIAAKTEPQTYEQAFDQVFLELAAQGQSAFTAAGDSGSYDASGDIGSTNLSVDAPGDSPWITSAGGMTLTGTIPLSDTDSAAISTRRAWGWDWLWPHFADFSDSNGKPFTSEFAFAKAAIGGGGGGYSAFEPEPGYQKLVDTQDYSGVEYLTPTTPKSFSGIQLPSKWTFNAAPSVTTGTNPGLSGAPTRAVPDVSANADPFTGYKLYFSKFPKDQPKLQAGWGGTSFVAPQFAGATAVMDSYVHHRIGFWNPRIYKFAASASSPISPVNTSGTSNNNLFYTGTPGTKYNPAAGLGTPDFAKLVAEYHRS
jgi:subtilase family serine protease